jgi:hypothetical protein
MSNHHFSVSMNDPGALERRLELLESRFTTPSHGQPLHHSVSSPEVATVVGSSLGNSPATTSHHSFGFDAPSGSRSSNSGGSNMSSASNLEKGLVRPKKQRRLSALDLVQLAAERQIQRVIAKSPLHTENSNMASHLSNAASNQTILTSHKSSQEESKVVAESPPVLTAMSPAFAVAGGMNKKPTAVKPAPVVRHQRSL